MPTYTPGLAFTRSDGSPSSWPSAEEQKPSNTENWWELLPPSHEKYDLYEKKVGAHIAQLRGITGVAVHRIALPKGYAIFAHHKPQSGGGERIDSYLRGCPTIGKKMFRSAMEFIPHAEWLLDESRPVNDHSTCECIYNNHSAAYAAKKGGSSSLGGGSTTKRPVSGGGASPTKPSKRHKSGSADDVEEHNAIVPERSTDMKTNRRFRRGELIWFRIDTINPPENRKGLPSITHWPGLVANATVKTRAETSGDGSIAGASASAAWAMAGAVAPEALKPSGPQKYTYATDYHIRPLGLFSSSQEIIKKGEDLLPWAMGNDLLGGGKGWGKLGQEGTRVMREGVTAELNEDKGKGIAPPADNAAMDARWKSKWAQRWSFREMPRNWESAVFRLGIAIKIASAITNSWTQTDKIDLVPGADVNPEDYEAIQSQKKTLYQGLWWGGERLWLEDMVRLKKHRAELPVDVLGLPSEGAADRAVLLRIRMITIEVAPDSTEEQHSWRCLIYGDIFELANAGKGVSPTLKIETDDGVVIHTHLAPKGLAYKQLNQPGSEVTVDISDIAGRVYPDLLDPATQKWFKDISLPMEENVKRVTPGETAKALSGLKPGTYVGSKSEKWKEDLYVMVSEANKQTESDMKNFYASLILPPGSSLNGASGGGKEAAGSANGLPADGIRA